MIKNPRFSRFDIGEWSYGEPTVVYWDAGATLRIGRYCSIAPEVTILLGGEHHWDWVTTYPFSLMSAGARSLPGYPHTKGDVVIGHDVWIGHGATILSGVRIGNGSVIGARAVVTRDIEAYSICVGSPASPVRRRFSEPIARALERIAWWNWPDDKVREAWPLLQSSDVAAFVRQYDPHPSWD